MPTELDLAREALAAVLRHSIFDEVLLPEETILKIDTWLEAYTKEQHNNRKDVACQQEKVMITEK